MLFEPKQITLKNNETVLIRRCELEDAASLMQTVKTYLTDSEFIPKNPDEFKLTLEQERAWIQTFLTNNNSLLLVAIKDDQIIGNIDITGNQRASMKHTAVIGMGILNDYRHIGLGTALLQLAIEWSQLNPILEILWLQVYTENKAALSLYKKMGFEENGIIKNFFKHTSQYYDNLTMSLTVK